MMFIVGSANTITDINATSFIFLIPSGIATGASWICYFKALSIGDINKVVPIDKLSILVTVAFSYIVFKEKFSKKAFAGLGLMVVGTLLMAFLSKHL